MKPGNIQLVVNPVAGNGKAKVAIRKILQRSDNEDKNIIISYTKYKNDATIITRNAISAGADLVVAVGGDGTINEVVNGFFENGRLADASCKLGIMDCGTGKGYASTLGIPRSTEKQIDLLFGSESVKYDVGHITCLSSSGEIVKRYFINECQIGIGSRVASIVGRRTKLLGGRIAFGLAATILAMMIKPADVEISFENGPFEEYILIGLVAGNGTECAGGMKLTPNAKMDDGLFDVLLIHEMERFKRLINLPGIYSGTHLKSQFFSLKRCNQLKIRSKNSLLIESDGEILGYSPIDINIMPAAIEVVTG